MNAQSQDQSETVPGTVFSPRQVRLLKIAVIVMGIMLVGGFALVLGTIVYQASHPGGSSSQRQTLTPAGGKTAISLEPGQSISHIALDGDRMAVYVSGPWGSEIRIIDLEKGTVLSRIPVRSE